MITDFTLITDDLSTFRRMVHQCTQTLSLSWKKNNNDNKNLPIIVNISELFYTT